MALSEKTFPFVVRPDGTAGYKCVRCEQTKQASAFIEVTGSGRSAIRTGTSKPRGFSLMRFEHHANWSANSVIRPVTVTGPLCSTCE